GAVVIDPTALGDMPDWSQSDYRVLWARVLQSYVSTVVFRDGWQYSNGCAWELLNSYLNNCALLREDLTPLDIQQARSLLAEAVSAGGDRPDTAFLASVLAMLDSRY